MGAFRQLGDPVCPDCLCQHHAEAYAEHEPPAQTTPLTVHYETFADGAVIAQVQITITETCCITVNAATAAHSGTLVTAFEIERPLGSIRTTQEDRMDSNDLVIFHHAAWEVLPAGIYTYFLVNRSGAARTTFGSWIKAIASDCLG